MTLSDVSIKNPVFAWMLMGGLIIFGAISFNRMGISQLPDVDFPVVNITLTDEGAAPETMETDVVDPIEGAVLQVEGVQDITSQSREGLATITVTFSLSRNIDSALADVQNAVVGVQRQLPTQMDPPQYNKTNPDDQPIVWVALGATDPKVSLRDMMIYEHDVLQDQFASVDGVGQVRLGGYLDPNLRVWMDGKKLKQYELTAPDVINTIQSEHVELPSGLLETLVKDSNVRTMGQTESVKEFGDMYINLRGGGPNYHPIPLRKVATVEEGLADRLSLSRSNGAPAIGMGIVKQRGTNAVAVAQAVKKKLVELNKTVPAGMRLSIRFDSTKFIQNSVHDLNKNLILAGLATAFVCWIFLGSWTATLNILLAIPTSIIGAFTILYFSGFTLNTFTLLGLSLSVGIVVDDAIMVLENIIRHQEMGKSKVLAAMDGARQITFAAMATSLAIVAIFLPVAFMQGIIGKYFYQFGVTVVAAVLLSLLEALTLTPMRCSSFVSSGARTSRFGHFVDQAFRATAGAYRKGLQRVLNYRWTTLIAALLIALGSMTVAVFLRKELIPPQDQAVFILTIKTPVWASLDYTDAKCKEMEKFFSTQKALEGYYVSIGGNTGGQLNQGFVFVTMKPKGQRPVDPVLHHQLSQQEQMQICRKALNKIPDFQAFILDLSQRGFSTGRGFPIEIAVRGDDWDKLAQYSVQLKQAMSDSGMMTDVDTDYLSGMPEVDVVPDRYKAAQHGVSVSTIAQVVNAMVGGEKVGQYPRSGHEDDIRVRLVPDQRTKQEQINDLLVRNNRGEVVPLSDVVTLTKRDALQQINRQKRQRTVTIYANVTSGKSQPDALAKTQELAKKILPKGYYIALSSGSTAFKDSFNNLIFALLLGVICAYMVLASQFNSFVDPFTVLMALPFSLSGAFLALWLSHPLGLSPDQLSLNIYSLIGLILLMGIVKKNSIMLVDFTNEVRQKKKLNPHDALLEACPIRFRPILMTSVAVIAAAVPAAMSRGDGCETQIPMATVIIGGVLVSTFFTLFVVPCFYSVVAPLESRHAHEDRLAEALEQKRLTEEQGQIKQ